MEEAIMTAKEQFDLALPHPGEILREDFLIPMNLSVYALAKAIGVTRPRINEIVHGKRAITPETALRLARYFGISAELWLNLQMKYDLDMAKERLEQDIEVIAPHKSAA
jgi:addiction module HigA family antidote